jgi:NAD(P)H-hydrate repair Nnr-like enzyme with NAD(P)H-hydrate epimerase domain
VKKAAGKRIAVLAGAGNNGGDALVAARFLAQRGAAVVSLCLAPKDSSTLSANHAQTLRAMGIECEALNPSFRVSADLIVDGKTSLDISTLSFSRFRTGQLVPEHNVI